MIDWYSVLDNKIQVYTKLEDFPSDTEYFVYIITNKKTGQYYIGKKALRFNRKKKLTQKELLEYEGKRGRKPKTRLVTTESDWKNYYSSNDQLKKDVIELGEENFDRKILKLCPNKKLSTYYETYYQFEKECLKDPLSYNSNILGTFYRKDLE